MLEKRLQANLIALVGQQEKFLGLKNNIINICFYLFVRFINFC
jgi:hypothetical protein